MTLDEYIEAHCSPEPEYLRIVRRNTFLKVLYPQMVTGHLQGRFLAFISRLAQPTNILEIGTFTGYSALCLCEGLKPNGKLVTIEINDELEEIIRDHLQRSPFNKQVELLLGDAVSIIPTLDKTFDLVFIDGHKPEYCEYLKHIKPRLKSGAIVIADNVLWYNKVIEINENDESTVAIRNFNNLVQNDPDFENVMIPIRDGILLFQYLPKS